MSERQPSAPSQQNQQPSFVGWWLVNFGQALASADEIVGAQDGYLLLCGQSNGYDGAFIIPIKRIQETNDAYEKDSENEQYWFFRTKEEANTAVDDFRKGVNNRIDAARAKQGLPPIKRDLEPAIESDPFA